MTGEACLAPTHLRSSAFMLELLAFILRIPTTGEKFFAPTHLRSSAFMLELLAFICGFHFSSYLRENPLHPCKIRP